MVVATNLHCQIFVGGLNDSVSDEQLGQFFCPYEQLVHVKILVGKRCGLVQFADIVSWIQTSGTVDLMDINLDMKLVEVLELLKIPICKMEAILDIEITCKAPNCSLCAIVYAFM
ncbi:hypothetical protein RHGRI_026283 [Rhododendron griersonianum]|uniref:RRM domain-containing protein n=1 Tax=Rhododendron griersonianum TaxID=479676 RepID=A0AAV6IWP2_9ERIC|nr:hypothetical protein RHGRI_026283 [Rhododendron griersonianum]